MQFYYISLIFQVQSYLNRDRENLLSNVRNDCGQFPKPSAQIFLSDGEEMTEELYLRKKFPYLTRVVQV